MSGILKELVEHLESRTAPAIVEHMGRKYSDKQLYPVSNTKPEAIDVTTLKAIVDYITQAVDKNTVFSPERYIISIQSPTEVQLLSEVVGDGSRWLRMQSKAITPDIAFGRFMDTEMFNITLQSKFVDNDYRKEVLAIVCNITDGVVTDHQDDGITQNVTVKAGITRVGKETVPNPVSLAPYRTFPEVAQPESPFVLRLKSGGGEQLPSAALFEADGSKWRLEAINSIKEYFTTALTLDENDENSSVVILA
jgi:hypothetical protein